MVRKVFSVHGMTCTSCSNTLYRGLSKLEDVTKVAVCLLTEKVIIEGDKVNSELVVDTIENLGFEGEEIKEATVLEGEIKFEIEENESPEELSSQLRSLNGVENVEFLGSSSKFKVEYTSEAIKAKEIAISIQDLTGKTVSVIHDHSGKGSMLEMQERNVRGWFRQFLLSTSFTIPIFVLSMIVSHIVDKGDLAEEKIDGSLPIYNLSMWVLATPVQFWFGWRFYKGAYSSLKHGTANMDVLVALGTSAAYCYGALMNFLYLGGYKHDNNAHYVESAHSFETSSLLISIILLGKYLESRSKKKTTDAITKLSSLQISHAVLLQDGKEVQLDLALLEVGDLVKVYPGSSVPVDGVVVEGGAWVNEAMMTGESSLVFKSEGSNVFGGTINMNGVVKVKVEKLGKDTALAQIISLVENAQATKPPIQAVADKISRVFVPGVVLLAIFTWIVWFSLAYNPTEALEEIMEESNETEFLFAFKFGISVLVIACPCALGLAVPTVIMVTTGVAARYGILIKDGEALENAARIKTVVFDKTGTLTSGKPKVKDFEILTEAYSEEKVKQIIASVESNSEHPVAKAIIELSGTLIPCKDFNNIDGEGVVANVEVEGEVLEVCVGNDKMVERFSVFLDSEVVSQKERLENEGKTVVVGAIEKEGVCLIALQEEHLVKPEAEYVISELHKNKYDVWMITGDNERCANSIARYLSIPEERVLANCYPGDKKTKVQQLQMLEEGVETPLRKYKGFKGVVFVGDGINDSPSLTQADIGIAIGGTDIAMEAANIVLMKDNLKDVLVALDLANTSLRRIKYNFFWAFIYNVLGIPLAAGVIYMWTGIYINSMMAGAAMALSSTAVVFSSLLLNRYKSKVTN